METSTDRRSLMALGTLLATGLSLSACANHHELQALPRMIDRTPPGAPKVAMLVYPHMVALDLIGPLTIFKLARYDVQLVWKDKAPVATDIGIHLAADRSFSECDEQLDVLFVPGGIQGTIACMNDQEVLAFLADRGARARWVTSVCTGALVLAAAGLLKGYDATAYWAVADLLPLMGARHVDQRVVKDRNRMTGGGVTAGLDFGLALMAELSGEALARRVQLVIEYAPDPPFKNGTPAEAGRAQTEALVAARRVMDEQARLAAIQAGNRLGI